PLDASATPYFTADLSIAGGSPVETAEVKVKFYSGADVAEAGGYLDPADDNHRIGVDLRQWAGRKAIDRIKVWVRSHSNAEWAAATVLREGGFTRATPPAPGGVRNLGAHASTYDVAPGSPVRIEIVNHDTRPLDETLTISTPPYVELDTTELAVTLAPGERQTVEARIARFDEDAADPTTSLEIAREPGQTIRTPVQLFVDPLIIGPPP